LHYPFLGFNGIFYISIVPGALAVIVLVFFVKEKFAPSQIKLSIAGNIRSVLTERRFIALLCIMGVFSIGAFNFALCW
jgi:hypothetical protein